MPRPPPAAACACHDESGNSVRQQRSGAGSKGDRSLIDKARRGLNSAGGDRRPASKGSAASFRQAGPRLVHGGELARTDGPLRQRDSRRARPSRTLTPAASVAAAVSLLATADATAVAVTRQGRAPAEPIPQVSRFVMRGSSSPAHEQPRPPPGRRSRWAPQGGRHVSTALSLTRPPRQVFPGFVTASLGALAGKEEKSRVRSRQTAVAPVAATFARGDYCADGDNQAGGYFGKLVWIPPPTRRRITD